RLHEHRRGRADRRVGTRASDQRRQPGNISVLTVGTRDSSVLIVAERRDDALLALKSDAAFREGQTREIAHLRFPSVRCPFGRDADADDDAFRPLVAEAGDGNAGDDGRRRVHANDFIRRYAFEKRRQVDLERAGNVIGLFAQRARSRRVAQVRAQLAEAFVQLDRRLGDDVLEHVRPLECCDRPRTGDAVLLLTRDLTVQIAERGICADDDAVRRDEHADQRREKERAAGHRYLPGGGAGAGAGAGRPPRGGPKLVVTGSPFNSWYATFRLMSARDFGVPPYSRSFNSSSFMKT